MGFGHQSIIEPLQMVVGRLQPGGSLPPPPLAFMAHTHRLQFKVQEPLMGNVHVGVIK